MKTLPQSVQKFILSWGERATYWGLNKTEAQIHALLFSSPKPLNAEEIATLLSVARSNVSNSLKELQRWGVVNTIHAMGDRRDYYESVEDVWEMFRRVIDEQKRRAIDPLLAALREMVTALDKEKEDRAIDMKTKERLKSMLELFEITTSWYDQLHSLPLPLVKTFLKSGSKVLNMMGLK